MTMMLGNAMKHVQCGLCALTIGWLCLGFNVLEVGAEETAAETNSLLPINRHYESFGYVNPKTGQIAIPFSYVQASRFTEGLAAVAVETPDGDRWGYINAQNQWVIKPRFAFAAPFSSGIAMVKLVEPGKEYTDTGYSFINHQGEVMLQTTYEGMGVAAEGLIAVKSDGKWGFMDAQGEWKIPPQFIDPPEPDAYTFVDGVAPACTGTDDKPQCGMIDTTGQFLSPPIWTYAYLYSDGLMMVADDTRKGYINKAGELVITLPTSVYPFEFREGLAMVDDGKAKGYIDKTGQWVIKPQFTTAMQFSEGLAAASVDHIVGFIDHQGQWVIPPTYHEPSYFAEFKGGVAEVFFNDHQIYIDKTGKRLWQEP